MSKRGRRRAAVGGLWALMLGSTVAAVQAQTAFTPDIAGVRLGMTEAEVRSALKAFDGSLEFTPYLAGFTYSDGVDHTLQTPEFLERLEAQTRAGYSSGFVVHFTTPPSSPRVMSVERTTGSRQPPSIAQFEDGLIRKYGEPTGRQEQDGLLWEQAGKPRCARMVDYRKQIVPMIKGITVATVPKTLEHRQRSKGHPLPADLSQCGAYVFYQRYNSDPVDRFTGELRDLGLIVANERATQAWVAGLEDAAVARRKARGQTPTF